MGDLFEGYGSAATRRPGTPPWDEMFADTAHHGGSARDPYREIHATLAGMTTAELRGRTDALASSYLAQGVTFDFAGEERPFPLDAVPRVIEQDEWLTIEAGVKQRVRALEAFLADVYGDQAAVRDGVLPARLISSSEHFHREAAGIVGANGVRIHVSGIDLIRDEQGAWRVLEDNVRVPSGVSYVISNRRVMAQTLPELFVSMRRQDLERRHPRAPVVDVGVMTRDRQDVEVREEHHLAVGARRQHARLVVRRGDLTVVVEAGLVADPQALHGFSPTQLGAALVGK